MGLCLATLDPVVLTSL